MSNPYTLVFGQSPVEMIDRTAQLENIISTFTAERPSNYINLVTGIRGCGKTVFLTQLAKRFEKNKDWIVINLNPQRDLLLNLAAKLSGVKTLGMIFKEAKINLQAFGLGVEIEGAAPIWDIEDALIKMLKAIKKKGKRILITIDEVVNSKDMRIFTSSYQIFLREDLPVFLVMTGLYKNIDRLRNSDGMTFLERAPRTVLSPLNKNAIINNYVETISVKEHVATKLEINSTHTETDL